MRVIETKSSLFHTARINLLWNLDRFKDANQMKIRLVSKSLFLRLRRQAVAALESSKPRLRARRVSWEISSLWVHMLEIDDSLDKAVMKVTNSALNQTQNWAHPSLMTLLDNLHQSGLWGQKQSLHLQFRRLSPRSSFRGIHKRL